MPAPLYRTAVREDLRSITALLDDAGLPLDGVAEHLDGFVVAVDGDAIVGCAALERYGHDALLRSVAVREDWRGAGVGGRLVGRLFDEAERSGVRTVVLLTTTAPDYFERFGFARIDRDGVPGAVRASVEFQGACPASAVVMIRNNRG